MKTEENIGMLQRQPVDHFSLSAIIAFALIIAAVNIAVFYIGFIASDDSLYTGYATHIANGLFNLPEKHWAFRYTVVFPLAGLIKLVGVSEQTILYVSLGYSAIMLAVLVWIVYRVAGRNSALFVAVLAGTAPILITLSSTLNADIPEALFMLISVSCFYFGWYHHPTSNRLFFCAGLAAGMAMLTRETAYGIGLFYMLYFLRYSISRFKPFLWLAIGTAAIIGSEMICYVAAGESPLYRLLSASQTHGSLNAAGSSFSAGSGNLSDSRIWGAPLALLLNQEFGLLFWLGIGCAIALVRHPRLDPETRRYLRFVYLAALVYFVWLGYSGTIRPLPRYFVFDLLIMLMPIAVFVSITKRAWLKGLIMLAACGASFAGLSLDNINQRYPDRMVAKFVVEHDGLVVSDGESVSRGGSFLKIMGGDYRHLVTAKDADAVRANYIAAVGGRIDADPELQSLVSKATELSRAPAPKLMIGKILDLTGLARFVPSDKYWWLAYRTPDVVFYRL